MAKTKTTRGSATKKKKKKKMKEKQKIGGRFKLPLTYEDPVDSFEETSVLVHGEKKIGKTTLALQQSDDGKILIIQFDRKQHAYRRLETVIQTWNDFMLLLKALEKAASEGRFPYSRVVVDGADIWYSLCQTWACEKLAIEHPSEEEWGRGWTKLGDTFNDAVLRVERLPCGRWYICHSAWVEKKTHDGKKIERLQPKLPSRAEEILNGRVDLWMAYDYVGKHRVLFLQGTEEIGAGHALDDPSCGAVHFRDKADGKPLKSIRVGGSAETAYTRLVKAYKNEYKPPKMKVKRKVGKRK